MNIRDNIVNYLFDKDYIISIYEDYVYFFNYKYLNSFGESEIIVSLADRKITLRGKNLTVIKMTKEELLLRGEIADLKVSMCDE